jgi:hypothetical protein
MALSTSGHVFKEAFVVTADLTLDKLVSILGTLEGCCFGSFYTLKVIINILFFVQICCFLEEVHVLVKWLFDLVGAST